MLRYQYAYDDDNNSLFSCDAAKSPDYVSLVSVSFAVPQSLTHQPSDHDLL